MMSIDTAMRMRYAQDILNKIETKFPGSKADIRKRKDAMNAVRPEDNTLTGLFRNKAFWDGFKTGFAAPIILLDHLVNGKPPIKRALSSSTTIPDVLSMEVDNLFQAIKDYCTDNSDVLEEFHLNNKERELLGLPKQYKDYDIPEKMQPV